MRGTHSFEVVGLLALTGAFTGAFVGLLAGLAWTALGGSALAPAGAAAVALAAVGLDVASWRTGWRWLRPLAVNRQVPVAWGRLLSAPVAAVLYGARLGVGPLTILTTWTWWAALVVGASLGPWPSALVGATFAVARTAIMTAVVSGATSDGTAMSRRITSIVRADGRVRHASVVAVVLVAALVLAACSGGSDDSSASTTTGSLALVPATTTTTTAEDAALDAVLLDETLDGFTRDDASLGAGSLDLEAAAQLEDDTTAERALLETRGFVRGASRGWVDADEDVVLLTVYQLGGQPDAEAYLEDGTQTLQARGATQFDVPEVPGALGFSTVDDTGSGSFVAHAVAFTVEDQWFLVLIGGTSSKHTVDDARSLAQAQYQRATTP